MSRRLLRWFPVGAALLVLVASVVPVAAGTTGKLQGRVLNEKKEPLAGVNIRVEGQRLGAVSDEQGNYSILAIPAGEYVVRANLIGFAAFAASKVQIQPDFTTDLNITLKSEAVQLEEVRVDAERPLLQKDATGTTRFLSKEDIAKLPTRGYRDAAAQQTGIVNFQRQIDTEASNQNTLIVRGGRPNETAYFVDGFSQQDPLTGTSSTSISNNAIQEVVVLTGGFNPEYGRIMSGVVNVVTPEGRDKYFGAVEAVSDVLAGDWIQAAKTDYNVYDVSLGGPAWPGMDNLTFYVSGERRWQRDRQPTQLSRELQQELETGALGGQLLNPDDEPYPELVGRSLDPDFKPANSSSGYTFQGKLAFQLSDQMQLKAGGLGSQEYWQQYSHAYLFDLDHAPRYEDRNQNYYGTFNHVLSTTSFYNVGVNYFETTRKRGDGVHFDRLAEYYRESNPRYDTDLPLFWDPGHVFDDYLQRKSAYWGMQGSYVTQLNRFNQLKTGADYQRHTLRYFNHYFPAQIGGTRPNLKDFDSYGYDLIADRDPSTGEVTRIRLEENDRDTEQDGPKHPTTWSLYAQDKYEREGVIVNGGLRFDHINVNTPSLLSETLPLGDPDAIGNITDSLETRDLTENKTYSRISPRLGIAFPVDERTILRFNYGQFFQQPNLQDLYVSYRFLQHKIRTGGYFVGFGNPNLRPERTTAYEVGMARQFSDNVRVDLTAYYKDVKDLVQITTVPSKPNSFATYRNRDFATIKGLDLGFTLRPTNHIGANIAYSLSFAQGTGSVSQSDRNRAWTASATPKQTAPLDFDQRHKLSANLDWRLQKGEGLTFGGMRPFENTGVNVLFNVASGTPYTPTQVYNEITLAAVSGVVAGPQNSRYGPWTVNMDLKATKAFALAGFRMEAQMWVLNVFDNDNPIAVYTSSGSPFSTNFLGTQDGAAFVNAAGNKGFDGQSFYQLAENNPTLFATPRLVRFGIRAAF